MAMSPVRVRLDDSPRFEAVADLDDRWNGHLKPRFTLDQVRKLAEYTQSKSRRLGVDWETVHVVEHDIADPYGDDGLTGVRKSVLVLWVSWQFTLGSNDPSKWTTVVDPDEDGLYGIGGGGWAWSEAVEPSRVPIEELDVRAGRMVRFVGEFSNPYDVASGKEVLPDWRSECIAFGRGKAPAENYYFSFSDESELEWDEMAALIEDLPVCLVMQGCEREMGLSPTTSMDEWMSGWEWSIAEAFTRLGMLPPVTEISLPKKLDFPRSAELVLYLASAYREGVRREIEGYPQRFSKTLELLEEDVERLTSSV